MPGKPNLFDDDSDDGDDGDLKINKDYAQRYEEWREAEVKRRLEDKYGSGELSSPSDSTDEDDDPEELEKAVSKDFFEVISSLKTKDPKIYNPKVKFFENEKVNESSSPLRKKGEKKNTDKNKPIYLRDYERKLITERGGQLSDDESDEDIKRRKSRALSPSYAEEQQQIKDSFKKVLLDDSDNETETLLQKRETTTQEKEQEEEEYLAWLKGEKEDLTDKETKKKLKPLKNLWSDPKLDASEKFLRDYVLNKRYLEKDETHDPENLTDDEYLDEYMNEFERNYNFRFEEPDKDFIKRYPRNIEQSLRRKDTKRKEKRKAVEERKKAEKKKKQEELKLLKSLKKKEILQKIEKIKQITGNDELGLQPDYLEEDFDPEAHDRRMQELFDDGYYEDAEDVEDVEDLNIPPLEEELLDDENWNWDEWDGTDHGQNEAIEETGGNQPHCEDPNFNMDCDYDPVADSRLKAEKSTGRKSAREKRKLKRQSRFGRLVRKKKPVFDPKDKTFEQYVDEYYGMDYEDLIDDVPCRFKYTNVVPNSFGLTLEEILAADDKELNRWASIKKTYTIRSEHVEKNEAKMFDIKARDEALKRKILPSLYKHERNNEDPQENRESKKKRMKKAQSKSDNLESVGGEEVEHVSNSLSEFNASTYLAKIEDTTTKKKKKKQKNENDLVTALDSLPCINSTMVHHAPEDSLTSKKKKKKNEIANMTDVSGGTSLKKKKKKNKGEDEGPSNNLLNVDNQFGSKKKEAESYMNDNTIKTKKKRKHQNDDNSEAVGKKRFKQSRNSSDNVFKKKNKVKLSKKGSKDFTVVEYSDSRLKAYGIHPKKYKKKLKYGNTPSQKKETS